MRSAVKLREDYSAEELRALARRAQRTSTRPGRCCRLRRCGMGWIEGRWPGSAGWRRCATRSIVLTPPGPDGLIDNWTEGPKPRPSMEELAQLLTSWSRSGGGWNWVGVVSGLFNPNYSRVGALERRPRHDERYHEGGGCRRQVKQWVSPERGSAERDLANRRTSATTMPISSEPSALPAASAQRSLCLTPQRAQRVRRSTGPSTSLGGASCPSRFLQSHADAQNGEPDSGPGNNSSRGQDQQ